MEFTLTGNPDQVVENERLKAESELAAMVVELKTETEAAIALEAGQASKISQMEKRKAIQDKHDASVIKAQAVLRSCRIRSRNSKNKMLVIENELAETKVAKKKLKKLRSEIKKKSTAVTGHLEMLSNVVSGLMSISSLVDVNSPILHVPDKMVWTTAPVFVFDKDGSVLPTNFGKFNITLRKVHGSLSVIMYPLTPVVRNSGMCHPHVKTDGSPCLGNASNQLLVALSGNDLQGAVMLVHNYLTHYNIADPWISLDWWEPNCLWHMPQCECGITTANNCGCDQCLSCGGVFPSSGGIAVESAYECKLCASCCSQSHRRPSEEDSNTNIPGSQCQHIGCN